MQQLAFLVDDDVRSVQEQLSVPENQVARLQAGGGDYQAAFVTPQEEQELLAQVDASPWLDTLRRRVQHYGYRYDYTQRHISADSKIGDLPVWVQNVAQRLLEQGIFPTLPEQMIVNEYQPGQGIAPHSDSPGFGDTIASLSLGSACMMRLFPHRTDKSQAFDIVLEPQSLVIFRGASRCQWQHAILARKSDVQNGCKIPRARRVSLTFRTVTRKAAAAE